MTIHAIRKTPYTRSGKHRTREQERNKFESNRSQRLGKRGGKQVASNKESTEKQKWIMSSGDGELGNSSDGVVCTISK